MEGLPPLFRLWEFSQVIHKYFENLKPNFFTSSLLKLDVLNAFKKKCLFFGLILSFKCGINFLSVLISLIFLNRFKLFFESNFDKSVINNEIKRVKEILLKLSKNKK